MQMKWQALYEAQKQIYCRCIIMIIYNVRYMIVV